jgi:tetraacyldisaccharide 4'-kinase
VGNITAGGSGKTPFTIYLAEQFAKAGFKIAVSHRGYKSELENRAVIISDRNGTLPASEMAGDESNLIANSLSGIPVVVGKDRIKAINLLCEMFPDLDCIILDDSFQNLKVKHDSDIVVINNDTAFGNGFVLPAGYLREPLFALKYADCFVVNCQNISDDVRFAVSRHINRLDKPVLKGCYKPARAYYFKGNEIALECLAEKKAMLLAGIGNPDSFSDTASELGLSIQDSMFFPDHFDYTEKPDRDKILNRFLISGADFIVTTEKDYAKLQRYSEFDCKMVIVAIRFETDSKGVGIVKVTADRISERCKHNR